MKLIDKNVQEKDEQKEIIWAENWAALQDTKKRVGKTVESWAAV